MNTPEHWRASRQFAAWFTNRSASLVRGVGYLMVCFAIYLFAHAAYDEQRGIAAPAYVPSRFSRLIEDRDTNPEMFPALMNYEWGCPFIFLVGGLVIIGIVRRVERYDPLSPRFAGKSSLDECERTLDAELRKKHSPLR